MSEKKELTIEEGFENLNDILKQMDDKNVPLEKSFELYNQGINIVKDLNERLAAVEGKLTIINEE